MLNTTEPVSFAFNQKTVIPALLLGIPTCQDMRSEINQTVKKKGNGRTEVLETRLRQTFRLRMYTSSSMYRFNAFLLNTYPGSGRSEIPAREHPNEWE